MPAESRRDASPLTEKQKEQEDVSCSFCPFTDDQSVKAR
jgi:hypothetical protein